VIADSVTLNLPLAAALSCVPVVAIVGYLVAVRRTGALGNL
jgi:putative spermidine/putrescine transport system permease protein